MDDETLNNLIASQFENLPTQLQQEVRSSALHDYIEEFAKERGLTVQQMNILENEFMLVLLGIERLDELHDNLLEHTDLDGHLVDQAYILVYENVLEPLEESLQSLYRRQDAAEQLSSNGDGSIAKSEEELDRDQILKEIEEPEKAQTRGKNYQSNQITMSELKDDKSRPSEEPTSQEERDTAKEAERRGYTGGDDPYREPLE